MLRATRRFEPLPTKRPLSALGLSLKRVLPRNYLTIHAYHWLLWQRYKQRKTFETSILGKPLIFNTNDRHSVCWFHGRLAAGQLHEPPVSFELAAAAEEAAVFADIGSHLGYYGCLVGVASPSTQVLLFEMNPKLAEHIHANVAANGIQQAEVVIAAAGAQPGQATFDPRSKSPGLQATFLAKASDSRSHSVPVVKLDDFFLNRPQPDLIKIDVEGAEGRVLEGARRILRDSAPTIFLELHPSELSRFDTTVDDVIGLLSENGYSISAFTAHRTDSTDLRPIEGEEWRGLSENMMLLCRHNSRTR